MSNPQQQQRSEPISILKPTPHSRSVPSEPSSLSPKRTTRIVLSEDEDDDCTPDATNKYLSDGEDEDAAGLPVSDAAVELLQTEKTVKAGYLLKKGEKRREYKLLRIIDLHEIHSVVQVTSKNKYKHVFAIITPKRMYYVQAQDQQDMNSWFEAIERTKAELRLYDADDDASSVDRDQEFAKDVVSSYQSNHTANMLHQRRRSSGGVYDASRRPSAGHIVTSPVNERSTHVNVPPVDIPKARAHAAAEGLSSYSTGHTYPLSPSSDSQVQQHMAEGLASSEDEEDYSWNYDIANVQQEETRNRVLIEGYLLKLGRNKGWRKRWFVLRTDTLAYYEDDKEYSPHRIIPLTHIIDSLEIEPISKSKRFCFKIIIPKRNYVLCASTEVDLESWLDALSVAVRRAKKEEGEAGSDRAQQLAHHHLSQIPEDAASYHLMRKVTSASSNESFENSSHISGAGGVGGAGGALGGVPASSGSLAKIHSRASERLARAK
ncbi:hypothetical protein EC973_004770 [Apophysomyces ossiformis]|uniref:PH domain-containing protein n=1 Tax=Apophysomyces ossiformis TaxID=679940 RepID=A0A8H7BXF3_9FUNG|nr:hypothetical protein EC973_004770 [Apophysomyces ossiformis]